MKVWLGIDPKVLSDILSVSTGNCWAVSACNPRPRPGILPDSPASKNYEGGFQTALMRKDLDLALSCAKMKRLELRPSFAEETVDYYAHLEKKGHGGKDFGYVFQFKNYEGFQGMKKRKFFFSVLRNLFPSMH